MNQSVKMENEKTEPEITPNAQENTSTTEEVSEDSDVSELNAACWSVVSFDKCIASGLNYTEATEKLNELVVKNIAGLCIVTDEAASRIK